MRRAQRYIYNLNRLKLVEVSSVYADSYLTVIGRKPKMAAWQVIYALF
jgi:hypothetical protein